MSTTHVPRAAYSDTHTAVLGKTGSGKTSTAKTMVEQLAAAGGRVCILDPIKSDWWGLKSDASGKGAGLPFVILGGPRQDLPLPPDSGAAIGRMVGTGELPQAIIDMSELTGEQLSAWYVDFAEALFKHNRGVMHLVLEEADLFAPKEKLQGNESMRIHWSSRLARAGRSKGIRLIASCQRTQKLHNDVMGSCETLVAHRLVFPADQKPILDWLKSAADKDTTQAIADSLATLQTGEAWVYCPEKGILERMRIPKITTFDNSKTPAVGDSADHVKTAAVDVDKIRATMADAIKAAEENDPKKLRARIAELEAEIDRKPVVIPKPNAIELNAAERKGWNAGRIYGAKQMKIGLIAMLQGMADEQPEETPSQGGSQGAEVCSGLDREDVQPGNTPGYEQHKSRTPEPPTQRQPSRESAREGEAIPAPLQRILDSLGWWAISGIEQPTRIQVATVANYSAGGGTFTRYVSELSSRGLVSYPSSGTLALTRQGQDVAAYPHHRGTLEQLHNAVRELLDTPHRKLLNVLLARRGKEMTRKELGELTGYEASGGTFTRYISHLSSLGFVCYPSKGTVAANAILFPKGLT